MKIGFDLDRVFINTPPFIPGELITKLYKKKDNGQLLYRIPSFPEQLFRRAMHVSPFRPPIKENLAFLRELSKKQNKLYLISSRYKFLEGVTNKLIKKYGLGEMFEGLYFNYENQQPHEFKNEVLKTLKLDMYIDDDLSLLRHVAKDNPQTKFFWLDRISDKKSFGKNIVSIRKLPEIFHEKL